MSFIATKTMMASSPPAALISQIGTSPPSQLTTRIPPTLVHLLISSRTARYAHQFSQPLRSLLCNPSAHPHPSPLPPVAQLCNLLANNISTNPILPRHYPFARLTLSLVFLINSK